MPAALGAENRPNLPRLPAARDSACQLWGRWLAARAAAGLSLWLGRRFKEAFGILTYHRVAWPVVGVAPPTCNVTPEQFRRQLTSLLEQGYEPWALRQVLEHHRQHRPIPRTTFVVTFDDGYENFYTQAWPVLRDLNVPATLFLATAYIDSGDCFPFDTWVAAGSNSVPAETWKPVTWAQCAAMLDDDLIEIGSHTHTHWVFRDRSEEFCDDLQKSLDILASRLGMQNAAFSFPFGICSRELLDAVRSFGVSCALTTQQDLVTPNQEPYGWGRFGVTQSDSGYTLAAKLDGWYSTARALWQSFRWRQSDHRQASGLTTNVPNYCDQSIPADQRLS